MGPSLGPNLETSRKIYSLRKWSRHAANNRFNRDNASARWKDMLRICLATRSTIWMVSVEHVLHTIPVYDNLDHGQTSCASFSFLQIKTYRFTSTICSSGVFVCLTCLTILGVAVKPLSAVVSSMEMLKIEQCRSGPSAKSKYQDTGKCYT